MCAGLTATAAAVLCLPSTGKCACAHTHTHTHTHTHIHTHTHHSEITEPGNVDQAMQNDWTRECRMTTREYGMTGPENVE